MAIKKTRVGEYTQHLGRINFEALENIIFNETIRTQKDRAKSVCIYNATTEDPHASQSPCLNYMHVAWEENMSRTTAVESGKEVSFVKKIILKA